MLGVFSARASFCKRSDKFRHEVKCVEELAKAAFSCDLVSLIPAPRASHRAPRAPCASP